MSFQTIETQFKNFLSQDPDTSISLGMTNKLGELSKPDIDTHRRRMSAAKELLDNIKLETSESFYQNLDLKLMSLYLKKEIFFGTLEINGKLQRQQKPGGVDGISEGVFQLFINDPGNPIERLDHINSRLSKAPEYLKAELELLDTPVERWQKIELSQAEGLPELFSSILSWAEIEKYPRLQSLRNNIENTNKALYKYSKALGSMPTTNSFAIGEDKVLELLKIREIDKSPKQLQHMSTEFVRDTNLEIDELRIRLNCKYGLSEENSAASLHDFLNGQLSVELKEGNVETVLSYYNEQKDTLLNFITKDSLFPLVENQQMKIMRTPGFLEPVIPAGAMWPPVPLRESEKISLVYLTLNKGELGEHTHLGIPVMMLHEGIPGHHLQYASACAQKSFIRKFFDAAEHSEGWTTMLEDYMLDQGLIDSNLSDEVRFVAKRDISRLGARVAIDLYFMTGESSYLDIGYDLDFSDIDPFANAAKLLKFATGFADDRIQAELNWYSTERGYPLSYLTGNRMVWQLKKELAESNTKQLSQLDLDREFHRIYLQSGCMPVNYLREVFQHESML